MGGALIPIIYLIFILTSITRLSESVYGSSISSISNDLSLSISEVQYGSGLFLVGISIGAALWGIISDLISKRFSAILGLSIYITCSYYLTEIKSTDPQLIFNFLRFFQGIGISCGIIVGQILTREMEDPSKRAGTFSILFALMSFVPTAGSIIGLSIEEYFGWKFNAYFMISVSCIAIFLCATNLRYKKYSQESFKNWLSIAKKMTRDPDILLVSSVIGCCNGISFSFYTEGNFYMRNLLNLDTKIYGASYILIGIAAFAGGVTSKKQVNTTHTLALVNKGSKIVLFSMAVFFAFSLIYKLTHSLSSLNLFMSLISILCMSSYTFGIGLLIPNCLTIATEKYTQISGSASSFLVSLYYSIMFIVMTIMATIHVKDFIIMPMYFFLISLVIFNCCTKLSLSAK